MRSCQSTCKLCLALWVACVVRGFDLVRSQKLLRLYEGAADVKPVCALRLHTPPTCGEGMHACMV